MKLRRPHDRPLHPSLEGSVHGSSPEDLQGLRDSLQTMRIREQELYAYIREKTNDMLTVIGTLPLRAEELDNRTLLTVDPIGIVTDSFRQVLENLRATNDELVHAKEEIQAIFESSGAGIVVVDTAKQIKAYNRKAEESFFSGRQNLYGRSIDSVISDEGDMLGSVLGRVLSDGEAVEQGDFSFSGRHYQVVGTPIKNAAGDIVDVILLYTDITQLKIQEVALHEAQQRLRAILNGTPAAITLIDPKTHQIVFVNQTLAEMAGTTPEEIEGRICHEFICPAQQGRCPITELGQEIDRSERVLLTAAGKEIPIIKTVTRIELDQRELLLESFVDITELIDARRKRMESEDRYRTLYSTMKEGVAQFHLILGADGHPLDYEFIDVNPAFEKIFGHRAVDLVGRRAGEIFPMEQDRPLWLDTVADVVRDQAADEFEYDFGTIRKTLKVSVAPMSPGHFSALFEDITQRKKDEARIVRMAYFDPLTDLPNRLLLKDRLSQMLSRARRHHKQLSLLFLDLDHFKRVNDTLGHDVGDQLLKTVADRLSKALRHCDTVCRFGGDEFVVLTDLINGQNDAVLIAEKIHETLNKAVVLKNKEVFITASIGIVMFPEDGEDADTLIKNADAAMYQSKDGGRDDFRFYSSNANAQALQRLLLAGDLRKALDQREFTLAYQPQVHLASEQIVGVEALLRWNHPALGNIAPDQFIPLAEESGLILPLGRWVLTTACREIGDLQKKLGLRLRVAVNLSAKQFRDQGLVELVRELLDNSGSAPAALELEITESTLMDNVDSAQKTIAELTAMGVTLAIDDFGIGYSSLSYLHHFHLDRLKIDRSFVRRLSTHPGDSAITEAIIVMAHTMGIEVVAEGVENLAELDFLTARGCEEAQGFHFSKPLSYDQLVEKLFLWPTGLPSS